MQYKFIRFTDEVSIAIPDGLPPDQETALIAQRMAELDPAEVAAQCAEFREMMDHPEKCIAMEDVLRELGVSEEALERNP